MAIPICLVVLLASVMVSHSALLDFCVAVPNSPASCKDPMQTLPEDFSFSGLDKAGNTSNPLGARVTPVNVAQIPGLNTLGISLARIDYAPLGLNPPHTHPRATEIIFVLQGTITVGFVTSNPENRHISKKLNTGDVFVFPEGLVHYQYNHRSNRNAIVIAGFSSENPGVVTVANTVFGSDPSISATVLSKAFQVDTKTIKWVQAQFTP